MPDAFDVYTVVVLRRPDDAPAMAEAELDELQARHLAYRAELRAWRASPATRSRLHVSPRPTPPSSRGA